MPVDNDLRACVEAALLTTGGPVAESSILDAAEDLGAGAEDIRSILEDFQKEWKEQGRAILLEEVGGGWRTATRPDLDDFLRRFHGLNSRQKLSQAALEVLSIVAYRQAVTLPEINFVRASNSSSVMKTLLERGLVRIAGRKKVVGKPFLYRTTRDFLIHFGLDSLEELPDPEELVKDPGINSPGEGPADPLQIPSGPEPEGARVDDLMNRQEEGSPDHPEHKGVPAGRDDECEDEAD